MISKFIQSKINRFTIRFIIFLVITVSTFNVVISTRFEVMIVFSLLYFWLTLSGFLYIKKLIYSQKIYKLIVASSSTQNDLETLKKYLKVSIFMVDVKDLEMIVRNLIFIFYYHSKNYSMAYKSLVKIDSKDLLLSLSEIEKILYEISSIKLQLDENVRKLIEVLQVIIKEIKNNDL